MALDFNLDFNPEAFAKDFLKQQIKEHESMLKRLNDFEFDEPNEEAQLFKEIAVKAMTLLSESLNLIFKIKFGDK